MPSLGGWYSPADLTIASAVLLAWQQEGRESALQLLGNSQADERSGSLLSELRLRLTQAPGPRLLVDGLWFARPWGGISRVWDQILRCWRLPGLITPQAPVALIDRNSHTALSEGFDSLSASEADPLDWPGLSACSGENGRLVQQWQADVFLSSWITTTAPPRQQPLCAELALVHDCMPERSQADPEQMRQRRRWLQGAAGWLAVSAASAADVEGLLQRRAGSVPWCHPAVDPSFQQPLPAAVAERLLARLRQRLGLRDPYVLLPSISVPGSYKNPEVLAEALCRSGLEPVQLLRSGGGSAVVAQQLLDRFPALEGRSLTAGLTELELALVYRQALAVVMPSRIEGFGLPALEALAAGGTVLLADSRGLREAGGRACLRFPAHNPGQLAGLLCALLDPSTGPWLRCRLASRRTAHLNRFHPHLLGLALLAEARRLSAAPPAAR
ncbi:MAG: glycosyltransferase family 4 protein [Cyanobacteria bacterium K_DeepCast_150m_m2_101]|nr:glycosyltransferase family 4 protein [Cyanobacteria bacterium K_DeepCast_150m_m2_101]